MGLFRCSASEFLLCYDGTSSSILRMAQTNVGILEFGVYVNRQGEPTRAEGVIEWEGKANQIAFHPPYVVIFDDQFIEVRHVDRGRLVQVIHGAGVRCLWDGRSLDANPVIGAGGWYETASLEATIHVVMEISDAQAGTVQRVFELAPRTLPNPNEGFTTLEINTME